MTRFMLPAALLLLAACSGALRFIMCRKSLRATISFNSSARFASDGLIRITPDACSVSKRNLSASICVICPAERSPTRPSVTSDLKSCEASLLISSIAFCHTSSQVYCPLRSTLYPCAQRMYG